MSKPTFLTVPLLLRKRLLKRERKHFSVCITTSQLMKALTHCAIQDFVRKLPQENLSYSLRAAYHSQRVYFQIQQWKGVLLKPEDWGWKLSSGKLLPIRTELPPADESLLEFVRCNCKKGCSTQKCTCRKNGLDSSPACGECKGYSCVNSAPPDVECDVE